MVSNETSQKFNILKHSYFINQGQTNAVVEAMLNELSEEIMRCEEKISQLTKEINELKKDTFK